MSTTEEVTFTTTDAGKVVDQSKIIDVRRAYFGITAGFIDHADFCSALATVLAGYPPYQNDAGAELLAELATATAYTDDLAIRVSAPAESAGWAFDITPPPLGDLMELLILMLDPDNVSV